MTLSSAYVSMKELFPGQTPGPSACCYFPSWGGKVITWVVSSGEKELDVQAPSFLSSLSLGCFLLALGFCALSTRASFREGSPELSEMCVSGRVSPPSCWVYHSEAFVPHSSATPSHLACVLISIYQTSVSVFSLVPSTDRYKSVIDFLQTPQ